MIRTTKALPLTLLVLGIALAFAAALPLCAHADDMSLRIGSITDTGNASLKTNSSEDDSTETAPSAQIKYVVKANGKGTWKADGATSSVADSASIESLRVKVVSDAQGSVQYAVNTADEGWQEFKEDSAVAGTSGNDAVPVGAVRIALVGELSQWYDVRYRVCGADGTWQPWKSNGKVAGKAGSELSGIQIELVEKSKKSEADEMGLLGIRYQVKMTDSDWQKWLVNNSIAGKTGKGKRIQSLALSLDAGSMDGGIQYRVRRSSGKWMPWKKDGAVVGPYKDIEAIQVKLTGAIAESYDVVYQTYVNKVEWQARMRNGSVAGTSANRSIEALKVKIEDKANRSGWDESGSGWSYYLDGELVTSQWIETTESPINKLTAKEKRYWLDADGKLAVKRIVDPSKKKDKEAGKAYYIGSSGYPKAYVKVKTSKGFAFSDEEGLMVTKKGWLSSDKYDDGLLQRYCLKAAGSYAVARTGLFKVNGKKFFGFDNKGYVMRDMSKRIQKKWYAANSKGVLHTATSVEIHRERYVQWAVSIANDESHGYTQDVVLRWGPDYDCSSLVISSLKKTGLNAGYATYTGNMRSELTAHGFRWHTDFSKLKRGDILLVHSAKRQHTEIYLGDNMTVGAHIAENGTVFGKTGDQTGHEIDVGPYVKIWDGYLRYKG